MFGVPNRTEEDPDPNRYFELTSADIVVKNPQAWHLLWDFFQLQGCISVMPQDSVLQNKALWTMQQIQNTFRTANLGSVDACRKIAEDVYGSDWFKQGAKVYEAGNVFHKNDYKLWGIGHTHIDSAWLWPFSATQQKVARSWSTQMDLMDRYPEYKFAASTAQQYWWLEQLYPKLFKKLQEYVKAGRFIPIGGTWVENDANLPSGEAFVRQFLYGQRYFKTRFGFRPSVFWLPDTFGYNSQIPQIARGCGTDYFFTQKLSWSNINRFPHNTMMWTGLDGTQIITHMTPVNNYDSMCGVDDIRRGVVNNQNLGVQPTALLLFGKGDGGGGPTAENIEKLRRARAIYNNGYTDMPKVHSGTTPNDFFDNVRKITDNGNRLPTWNGEVYLEFHRGVYTSHGSIKRWNRKLELLLQLVEWTATLASLKSKNYEYPKEQLDHIWEPFLLCQFHDVLPGSSIRLVYEDAERIYADVNEKAQNLLHEATKALKESGSFGQTSMGKPLPAAINSLGIPRLELISIPRSASIMSEFVNGIAHCAVQESNEDVLVVAEDKTGLGLATIVESPTAIMRNLEAVSVDQKGNGNITIRNNAVSLSINGGRIASLQILGADATWRELIPAGRSGGLSICEDYPPQYDAWETDVYSLETDEELKFDSVRVTQRGAWRSTVELASTFGKSNVTLRVTLDALAASHLAATSGSRVAMRDARSLFRFDADIDWQEKHRFLRFELPTILRSDLASFETQFGITKRPTYRNTSWDAAKFEVCGHKFADLSETMLGVALVTDSKYGYSIEGGLMRLSLLKGATYPDAHQDEGKHKFSFGIYPHVSVLESSDVVHVGRLFNAPLALTNAVQSSSAASELPFWLEVSEGVAANVRPVILDTVKRGEEDFPYYGHGGSKTKTVILRLYEAMGSHTQAVIATSLPLKDAMTTNMLEDSSDADKLQLVQQPSTQGSTDKVSKVALSFAPFQVRTVKLILAA